jgi:actin related protein 2/3 complex subunit 2
MAAPFEKAIDTHHQLAEASSSLSPETAPSATQSEVMVIRYRDEEAMYIQASHDRVTVIFSTVFREETDRVFGKVFLSEFVDARRRAIQNAPQVLYRNDPPLEIRGVPGVGEVQGDVGYITFVLFPRHLTRQRREESISHIQTFRDYFHYHIKAAKVGSGYLIQIESVGANDFAGLHALKNASEGCGFPQGAQPCEA